MKRTKFPPKKKEQSIPINLIRSIAWTFYKSSSVNWDELFSEACLAYCESIRKYDPTKGASPTTWVYIAMRNALINFCKKEYKSRNLTGVEDWVVGLDEPVYEFFQDSQNYSKDVQLIIELVKKEPDKYHLNFTRQFGNLWRDLLSKEGWAWARVWKGMRDLKTELNQG